MTSPISLSALVKEYPGGVRGVDGIDLEIGSGEFFALLGPSGCGKTTLLRSIAGLETITEGTLRIGDAEMTRREPGERGVAMVFQDYALFPHMDVADNIAYPLRIQKMAKKERREVASRTGGRLSLEALLERRPGQLSGGQQQRVALARAMAARPEVLLLDEPLSNLDARLRIEARGFLKELQQDLGLTTVFVTHDQAEALALADRIAVMRAGKIEQVGTPREVFHRPRTMFVASFIGSQPMNLLPGRWADGEVEVLGGAVRRAEVGRSGADAGSAGTSSGGTRSAGADGEVVVGIRPEYVSFTADGDGADRPAIRAEVVSVENQGATVVVTGRVDDERIQAIVPDDEAPEVGSAGVFGLRPPRVLLFDPESGERLSGDDTAITGEAETAHAAR
jgi:multiple sugar transport system ATP-binding protein